MEILYCPKCRRRIIPPKQFNNIKARLNLTCGYPNCKGSVTLDRRDKTRYIVYTNNKEVNRSNTISGCMKYIIDATALLRWDEYFKDNPTHIIDTEEKKKTIWSTKSHYEKTL